jgi:hypothetical protein
MYWSDGPIQRADLDGMGVVNLTSISGSVSDVALGYTTVAPAGPLPADSAMSRGILGLALLAAFTFAIRRKARVRMA